MLTATAAMRQQANAIFVLYRRGLEAARASSIRIARRIVLIERRPWSRRKRGHALRTVGADRVTVVQAAEGQLTTAVRHRHGRGPFAVTSSGPTAAGRVQAVAVDVGDSVKPASRWPRWTRWTWTTHRRAGRPPSPAPAAPWPRRGAAARRSGRRELAAVNARRYTELGGRTSSAPAPVEGRLQEQASSADALGHRADANLAAARQDQLRLAPNVPDCASSANVRLLARPTIVVTSRDAEPGSTVVAGRRCCA